MIPHFQTTSKPFRLKVARSWKRKVKNPDSESCNKMVATYIGKEAADAALQGGGARCIAKVRLGKEGTRGVSMNTTKEKIYSRF